MILKEYRINSSPEDKSYQAQNHDIIPDTNYCSFLMCLCFFGFAFIKYLEVQL